KMHECFPVTEKTIEYLQLRTPKSMTRTGEIISVDGTEMFGEHPGVVCETLGEEVQLEAPRKGQTYFAQFQFKEKRILVTDYSYCLHTRVHLTDCTYSEE